MGLSVLAFITALGILVIAFLGRGFRAKTAAARLGLLGSLSLSAYALVRGFATLGQTTASSALAILAAKASASFLELAFIALFAFALAFPRWPRAWLRLSLIPLALLALGALGAIWLTPYYLNGAKFRPEGFFAQTGWLRDPLDYGLGGLGLLGALILGIRIPLQTQRVNRERLALAFFALAVGLPGLFILGRQAMDLPGLAWPQILPPLVGLVVAALLGRALAVSRIFDWRDFLSSVVAYIAIGIIVGLPLGGFLYLVVLISKGASAAIGLSAFLGFLLAQRWARGFIERFFLRLTGRRDYREVLESSLAHVDLSAGRDEVLEAMTGLLKEELGCADLGILVEDDKGALKPIYTSGATRAYLDRKAPVRAYLEKTSASVLMRSEVEASPEWVPVLEDLLGLFDSLKAEVLILAREGRRIIGVFAFGPRSSGEAYTDYDYRAFESLQGKLFVFAFYFKNVARESILYTVDRELALSDQVIRFALEHVAPVDHPRAEAAWAMKSTRSLGGDFVDFVKIGKERYFFVLGDVSGKGLSASMNMLILKSMIRTFLKIERDFTGLVQRVNAFIKDYLPKGSFFAGVFGYFDFEKNTMYFINCGVPAMFLYSPSFDAFIEIQGEGKILGFVKDVSKLLKPRKIALAPGSALVAVTDGLLDSENIRGERYGKDRLRKAARDRLDRKARDLADGVLADLLDFTDNRQEDDISLLVVKLKG